MNINDLRFLLKDKYNLNESEISKLLFEYRKNGRFVDNRFQHDLEKIKDEVPLAYIIGYVDFLDCRINLDESTLIPRPETEYMVEKIILDIRNDLNELKIQSKNSLTHNISENPPLKILDIFSGSGCMGIPLLKTFSNIEIDFADISQNCINKIKENVDINIKKSKDINKNLKESNKEKNSNNNNNQDLTQPDFQSKINYTVSDIFESEKFKNKKYDYILANPPYVPVYEKVSKSILYEPYEAIFAQDNGLRVIKKFLNEVPKYLNSNGKIYMEFGDGQKTKIQKILKEYNYKNFTFHKDQFRKYRWVEITKHIH